MLVGAFGSPWLWQGGWPLVSESRDGKGASDHDKPFVWGQWRVCLTVLQQARLTVMRGYVLDTRAGIRGLAADGDLGDFDNYVQSPDSGLFLPK